MANPVPSQAQSERDASNSMFALRRLGPLHTVRQKPKLPLAPPSATARFRLDLTGEDFGSASFSRNCPAHEPRNLQHMLLAQQRYVPCGKP